MTTYITLKGRARWAQVYEPEEFMGDIRWKISIIPFDDAEMEKFKKSGLQQVPKEDAEGNFVITFRRSYKKAFPKDDEVTYFNPPEIRGAVQVKYVNAETGEVVRSFKKSDKLNIEAQGEKVNIGNDSVVLVNLAVYEASKGKGHRLEQVTVLDLVEYNPENKSAEVVPEAEPAAAKTTKKATKNTEASGEPETTIKEDMNDSIPW